MRRYSTFKHSLPFSTPTKTHHFPTLIESTPCYPQCAAADTAADSSFYASLLRKCAAARSILETRSIHLHMTKTGFPYLSIGNTLVDAYLKCGANDDARKMFDELPKPHIVSWNNMISSYIRCKRSGEAIEMYRRMLVEGFRPDEYTFSSILRAFADGGILFEGRRAHGRLVVYGLDSTNGFIGSALIDMYARFGRLREAQNIFDRVAEKDVVLVTAMIAGYTRLGNDKEALCVYGNMIGDGIQGNEYTFSIVLVACGNLAELSKGMYIHGAIIKSGFEWRYEVQTSLLVMYSKCSLVDDSLKIFNQIKKPNTVTWTALIGVLVSNHREEDALFMFCQMVRDSAEPNEFTLSTALRACSSLAMFIPGKQIHVHSIKIGLDRDKFVGAALVNMYGKCGNIKMASLAFDCLPGLDVVPVNSMIYGYAQNGYGDEAIKLFDRMQTSGLEPNEVTFTSVLSACSNSGLLEEGRRIFSSIPSFCKSGPSKDHYSCLVDLLGRAGRLEEAELLMTNQANNSDVVLWRTFLSACKIHGKVELAEKAARKILELDPQDGATHVLLSNIYASSGKWNEVIRMKMAMREMKLKKDPAQSWVEVDKEVHTFLAGDRSHPMAELIYEELERLIEMTADLGYIPDTRFVLQELDEMEKGRSLYYHSEKLAIAFAVRSDRVSKTNACIMIFKNLRVCGDCHTWIKFVTKAIGREITARDAKRFHHFKDGICSCRDFW